LRLEREILFQLLITDKIEPGTSCEVPLRASGKEDTQREVNNLTLALKPCAPLANHTDSPHSLSNLVRHWRITLIPPALALKPCAPLAYHADFPHSLSNLVRHWRITLIPHTRSQTLCATGESHCFFALALKPCAPKAYLPPHLQSWVWGLSV